MRGRVVGASGQPLAGVLVAAGELDPVFTGADGTFALVVGRKDAVDLRAFEVLAPLVTARATVSAEQDEAPDLVLPKASPGDAADR